MRRLIGALINDLTDSATEPFILVLDDVHVLTEPTVFAGLDYFIERLPAPLRLALGAAAARPRAVRIQSLHRPASVPCGRH